MSPRRRVTDTRPKRPSTPGSAAAAALSAQPPSLELTASALVGWGKLVVMGDAEGRLTVWDTASGRASVLATGCVAGFGVRIGVICVIRVICVSCVVCVMCGAG